MKITKRYGFNDGRNVWRILITDTDKIVLETRETESKEVFYNCLDFHTGEIIFKEMQLDEKYWIGIETIKNDVIFFHKFASPDMPGHKQLIAYSINEQKTLWQSDEYVFLFYYKDKIYGYLDIFEGRKFYTVNPETGEFIEDLGTDAQSINALRELAREEEDYSDYRFTYKLYESEEAESIVGKRVPLSEIAGDAEFIDFHGHLFFNYHRKLSDGKKLRNEFAVVDKSTGNTVFELTLNKEANHYAPDSFFIYKNKLITVIEKNDFVVFDISENESAV